MTKIDHRRFKDELYGEFARIGGALASPKRLEILDLLAQRERSVENLAAEMHLSVANASRHLRVLAAAKVVVTRRHGTFVHYALASIGVYRLVRTLQALAAERLPEVDDVVARHVGPRDAQTIDLTHLPRRALLLDVRPEEEYRAGHIPGARNLPVERLAKRGGVESLPSDREIVVYCRGAYCVWADEAVELLRRRGFTAHRLLVGPAEVAALGERLETA